jgi:putative oxidoreductase
MADWVELRRAWEPRVLSILRIVVGLLFLEHGLNKFFGFPASALPHHPYVLVSLVPGLAGILETVGGVLIILGLFTRPAAFILSGEMAFAYFMAHAPHGFFPLENRGEGAVFYCFVFLYLFVAGGGEWALDRRRGSA